MKHKTLICKVVLVGLILLQISSCKKNETVLTVTVDSVTKITANSAISGGIITSVGSSAIISQGVCWSTLQNPTIANDTVQAATDNLWFTSNLSGLQPNTRYYIRAFATDNQGTVYSNLFSFKTIIDEAAVTVVDIDGNVYKTITIGNQTWMAENLKTTRYRNGNQIPCVINETDWAALKTGAYCWYDNNANFYKADYGALYNWYAVTDINNIAPIGWHVATDAEWKTLIDYLGGILIAGGKLKELGIAHWASPNIRATNSSGFNALPGGYRYVSGTFGYLGYYGFWWSSTEYSSTIGWLRSMDYNDSDANLDYFGKSFGFSVRCLRD